jgi:hypothetical protein
MRENTLTLRPQFHRPRFLPMAFMLATAYIFNGIIDINPAGERL